MKKNEDVNKEAEEDDTEEEDEKEEEEDKDEDSIHTIFIADVSETKTEQPGRMRERTRSPLEAGRCQLKEDEDESEEKDEDTMRRGKIGSRIPA